jgi:hypothetical protein
MKDFGGVEAVRSVVLGVDCSPLGDWLFMFWAGLLVPFVKRVFQVSFSVSKCLEES